MEPPLLDLPLSGRVLVRNSPASRVPSHGATLYGTSHSIDLVVVDPGGRSAPFGLAALIAPEPPERFAGFGAPVLAPGPGVVVRVLADEADHPAYRGFPSVRYAATQARRTRGGWAALAGNHVTLRTPEGLFVTVCHLRRHSVLVAVGDRVAPGQPLGACGNSGNSTEPHVHLQVNDSADPERALGVPFAFRGPAGAPFLPRNGEVVGP